jgi:hypothetical protein
MVCIVEKIEKVDLFEERLDFQKTKDFLIGKKIKRTVRKINFSPRTKSNEYETEYQEIFDVVDRENSYIPNNSKKEKHYEIWTQGRSIELSKHRNLQMKDLTKSDSKIKISQELVVGEIFDQYRIVKVTDPKGILIEQVNNLTGKLEFVRLPPEKGLFMPQIKIEKKWWYMTIGVNQITKRPNNPAAFHNEKECEEYIMDYHSKQVAIQTINKKNQ